jgi:dynein heavy chain 1, cytosolic
LQKYEQSSAANFAELRDIPPVAGKIMWAKLMENQLNLLMEKMESVLGEGWEQQVRLGKNTNKLAHLFVAQY